MYVYRVYIILLLYITVRRMISVENYNYFFHVFRTINYCFFDAGGGGVIILLRIKCGTINLFSENKKKKKL